MQSRGWRATPAVAWTNSEGPSAPPRAVSPWQWYATGATLLTVLGIILFDDSLCPEHRGWVEVLATIALVLTIAAVAGSFRGWLSAPFLALGAGASGIVVGAIDATHSPVRGGIIVAGFVLAEFFGAWLTYRQVALLRWDASLRSDSTFAPEPPIAAADASAAATDVTDDARQR